MTSEEFQNRFQPDLPSDWYVSGPLNQPIGLYAVRQYPPWTKMPDRYTCLVHLGYYEDETFVDDSGRKGARLFLSIDSHLSEEFRQIKQHDHQADAQPLPSNRPEGLRFTGEHVFVNDEIEDTKGNRIGVTGILDIAWDYHLGPLRRFRGFPFRSKRWLRARILPFATIADKVLAFALTALGEEHVVKENRKQELSELGQRDTPAEESFTPKRLKLFGEVSFKKPTILIWAATLAVLSMYKAGLPKILAGTMSNAMTGLAWSILLLSFIEYIVPVPLKWGHSWAIHMKSRALFSLGSLNKHLGFYF